MNIRVDQVLTEYQKLDVASRGNVDVNEFVTGVLRMKESVQGMDVAAAKSWTRRICADGIGLAKNSSECRHCLMRTIESLRGIMVVRERKQDRLDSAEKERRELVVANRETWLLERNAVLRKR